MPNHNVNYTECALKYASKAELYGKKISEDAVVELSSALQSSDLHSNEEFTAVLDRACHISRFMPTLGELLEIIDFNGRSKEQAVSYAGKLYRQLENADDRTDIYFADRRALIAFYLVYGSHDVFVHNKCYDVQERFAHQYVSCRLNDYTDTCANHYIQTAKQRRKVQPVLIIGDIDSDRLKANLDGWYGPNCYHIISDRGAKSPLEIKALELKREQMFEEQRKESARAMENAIRELKEMM